MRLALCLTLLLARPAWAQDSWEGVGKVVAVGDVHGDYARFAAVLQSAGLVDAGGRWTGGRAHLVQTGDVLDRGPSSRLVMDLLRRLESQARQAGGAVHALLGNHEAMNLYGDLRYTTPEELASYRDLERSPRASPTEGHRRAFSPDGPYGRWLRGLNAVVRINGTVFLHGGIGPRYSRQTVRELNEAVRGQLAGFPVRAGGITDDPEGPLWYRGLARGDEEDLRGHVDKVLARLGARRIVVGHTPNLQGVRTRFAGKVVLIDVGLSSYYGGPLAALVLEGDRAYALHEGRVAELEQDPDNP